MIRTSTITVPYRAYICSRLNIYNYDDESNVCVSIYHNDYADRHQWPMIVEYEETEDGEKLPLNLWACRFPPQSTIILLYNDASACVAEYGGSNESIFGQLQLLLTNFSDNVHHVTLCHVGEFYLREAQIRAKNVCAFFIVHPNTQWQQMTRYSLVINKMEYYKNFRRELIQAINSTQGKMKSAMMWLDQQFSRIDNTTYSRILQGGRENAEDAIQREDSNAPSESSSSFTTAKEIMNPRTSIPPVFNINVDDILPLIKWHYQGGLVNLLRTYDISFNMYPKNAR